MNRIIALTLATAGMAVAQAGLYAPAPPSNSAFVRVVGASKATLGLETVIAAQDAASAYVVVPQGSFSVKVGGVTQKINVQSGKFYSVIWRNGKLTLLNDQAADNRAKALLTIYNLTTMTLDLKTADGKLDVISNVKPQSSGSRMVNGVTVGLAVFEGGKSVSIIKAVELERGNAYALVATPDGLTLTQSSTK